MIYSLKDVDKAVKKFFEDLNIVFKMKFNNKITYVRPKVIFSSPDKVLQKRFFPCIVIISGYSFYPSYIRQQDVSEMSINSEDENLIDIKKPAKAIDYKYMVQHIAEYEVQDRIFQEIFLKNIGLDSVIDINGIKEWFILENISNLDEYSESLFRKSYLIRVHLNLDYEEVLQKKRPFVGLEQVINVN